MTYIHTGCAIDQSTNSLVFVELEQELLGALVIPNLRNLKGDDCHKLAKIRVKKPFGY